MDGLKMKYFVLKPDGKLNDPYAFASRAAIKTYAYMIEVDNPELSIDLKNWVEKIEAHHKEEQCVIK